MSERKGVSYWMVVFFVVSFGVADGYHAYAQRLKGRAEQRKLDADYYAAHPVVKEEMPNFPCPQGMTCGWPMSANEAYWLGYEAGKSASAPAPKPSKGSKEKIATEPSESKLKPGQCYGVGGCIYTTCPQTLAQAKAECDLQRQRSETPGGKMTRPYRTLYDGHCVTGEEWEDCAPPDGVGRLVPKQKKKSGTLEGSWANGYVKGYDDARKLFETQVIQESAYEHVLKGWYLKGDCQPILIAAGHDLVAYNLFEAPNEGPCVLVKAFDDGHERDKERMNPEKEECEKKHFEWVLDFYGYPACLDPMDVIDGENLHGPKLTNTFQRDRQP